MPESMKFAMRSIFSLLLLTAGAVTTAAHPLDATAPAHLIARPAALAPGIGRETLPLPAAGRSRAARELHAQGLAQLHAYRWIEAARAFRTALRIEDDLLVAHLGLVRSYEAMKDRAGADAALARAEPHGAAASERDRALFEAFRLRRAADTPGPQGAQAHEAYRAALDRLIAQHPADIELLLLRGNAAESVAWGKGMAGHGEALPFYERAVERAPQHAGARHYLAHTQENLGNHFEAATHAAWFARLAPRAPHARHMYGHTLPRLGKWDQAIEEFEAAAALEEEYHRGEGIPARMDWHHVHNLNLLGLAYLRVGRTDDAERTLARAFRTGIPDPQTITWHSIWPEYLIHADRAPEAEAAARTLTTSEHPVLRVAGHTLAGEAALSAGDSARARSALDAARAQRADWQLQASLHPMGAAFGYLLDDQLALLEERLAFAAAPEDPATQAALLARAEQFERQPGFDAWGSGWLRTLRLEADARRHGEVALADRLATLAGGVPQAPPSDATR